MSIFNSILTRIMKEKKIFNSYKDFIHPEEIDRQLRTNIYINQNSQTIMMTNHFISFLYTASRKQREKIARKLYTQQYITTKEWKRFENFNSLFQYTKNNLNGLIMQSLKPWCLYYIPKLLGNNLSSFENYISLKHKNKINTLEEYINHCIQNNRNVFNLIRGVILFTRTQEGRKFWDSKNLIFTNDLLKLLLSNGNMQSITHQETI